MRKKSKKIKENLVDQEDTFFETEEDIWQEQPMNSEQDEPSFKESANNYHSKPSSKEKQSDEYNEAQDDVKYDQNNMDTSNDNDFFSYEYHKDQQKYHKADKKTDKRKSRLSIIGGPGSGKTTYIYALGKQARSTEKIKGWKIGYLTEVFNEFFSDAHVNTKNDWQRTKSGSLKILDMFPMIKGFTKIMVSTFDAAGEDYLKALMESKNVISQKNNNLSELQKEIIHSDGYIFLIDSDLLEYQYKRESIYKDDIPPHDILHNLKQLIINNSSRSTSMIWKRKKIKKPIAFVLTKADLIVDQLEHFRKAKSDGEKVDIQILQEEAETFIKKKFSLLYKFTRDFKNKSFYAISALGEEPDYYRIPDPKQPEKIEVVDRNAALQKENTDIKVKIKVDVPPVCIEEPLIDVLDQIDKTKKKNRIFKFSRILAVLLSILIFYFSIADGLIWLGSKNESPGISKICYQLTDQMSKIYPQWLYERIQNKMKHIWYDLGRKYYKQGDYVNAYSCLKRYFNPNDNSSIHRLDIFNLFINISAGLMEGSQIDLAIECLQEASRINIDNKKSQLKKNRLFVKKFNKNSRKWELTQKIHLINTCSDVVDTFPKIKQRIVNDAFDKTRDFLKSRDHDKCLDFMAKHQWMKKGSLKQYRKYKRFAENAKGMVFIPESYMNNTPAFYIDPYEVTNKQYAKLMKKHKELKPKYWNTKGYKRKSPTPECPVIYISQKQASRYAMLIGKRLPSDIEFESAWGRYEFPWGNYFKKNSHDCANTRDSKKLKAIEVSSPLNKMDKSAYNVFGLCGNVSEFINNPEANVRKGLIKLIKGGNFYFNKCQPQHESRRRNVKYLNRKATRTASMPEVGFRCAMSFLPK